MLPRLWRVGPRLSRLISSGVLLDVITVVLVLLLSVGSARTEDASPSALAWATAALGGLSLAWRRPFPEPVLLVCLVSYALSGVAIPAMLALGTVAAVHGPVRRTWTWGVLAAAVVVAVSLSDGVTPVRTMFDIATVAAFPLALGLFFESRAELLREARSHAAELEATAELRTEQARQEERARIAREMHDVVAHRVSLIALQAGALEVTLDGRPEARTAELIHSTARQALEELRQVVGVLRDPQDTAERVPTPGLGDVPELVRGWQAAGVPVELDGTVPETGEDTLSTSAGRAVYRVVQEALTNASKHAPGAPVQVGVTTAPDGLDVVVRNGTPTKGSSRARTGSGSGLVGLRERVALAGGRFDAGAVPEGGFVVHAVVPVREGPADPDLDAAAEDAVVETSPDRRPRDWPFLRDRGSRSDG
jgi:signal transduction histidine kinase